MRSSSVLLSLESTTTEDQSKQPRATSTVLLRTSNYAIQLSPQFVQAYINLGSAKANTEDLDGAIADFNHAVRLDPDSVQALENLGSAKARKGDFEGAIADYNQGIQLEPKDFSAFEMRALTKQLKGDFEGALGDLVLFDELAPPGESQDYPHLSWSIPV